MLRLLFNLKMNKIKKKYNAESINAGVVFNNDGVAVDKIMFEVIDGNAVEVFSDSNFSLNECDNFYISNIVSLEQLLKHFFNKSVFTSVELLMAYKMFLNDSSFLNRNLEYFGLYIRPVGYKEKYEIARAPHSSNIYEQNLYYSLMDIIYFENLNQEKINEVVQSK